MSAAATLSKLRGSGRGSSASAPTGLNQSLFEYTAVATNGVRHSGKMRAGTAGAVAKALQDDGWMPLSITETGSQGLNTDLTALLGGTKKTRLKVGETADFFQQMAELLDAGVPLSSVLGSIAEEAPPKQQYICEVLIDRVNAGVPLSEALGDFPDAFDDVARSYVAAGEASGTVADSISLLAENLDKKRRLQLKIKSVTAYPKFVSIAIVAIVLVMINFMVPMFTDLYAGAGEDLPAATQLLVDFSDNMFPVGMNFTFPTPFFLSNIEWSLLGAVGRIVALVGFTVAYEAWVNRSGREPKIIFTVVRWVFIVSVTAFAGEYEIRVISAAVWAIGISAFLGLRAFLTSSSDDPKTAKLVDSIKFRMPVFGGIIQRNALFQWASTLGGSLGSGVSMSQALELSARASGSRWHLAVADDLRAAVTAGRPLSAGLSDHGDLYPGTVRAMVATGEKSGDLSPMLTSAAATIENEIDTLTAGLSAKVEVALLMFMGITVGGVLMALYLPVLQLAGTVG